LPRVNIGLDEIAAVPPPLSSRGIVAICCRMLEGIFSRLNWLQAGVRVHWRTRRHDA